MKAEKAQPHSSGLNQPWSITPDSAVAGLKMAHLRKITSAFEFAVLTLTVPGFRLNEFNDA